MRLLFFAALKLEVNLFSFFFVGFEKCKTKKTYGKNKTYLRFKMHYF